MFTVNKCPKSGQQWSGAVRSRPQCRHFVRDIWHAPFKQIHGREKEAITRGQTESDESAPIVVITPQIGDTFAHRRIFPQVSPHFIFDDSGVNDGLRSCHRGGRPCPTSEAQEDAVDAHNALPSSNFWASDDGGLRAVNQKREGQQLEHWENRCARKGCGTYTTEIRVKIPNNGIKRCMREAATNSSC